MAETHKAEQNDKIEHERQVGVDACAAVVEEHKRHDREHAGDRGHDTLVNAGSTERRPDCAGFQVLDGGGE